MEDYSGVHDFSDNDIEDEVDEEEEDDEEEDEEDVEEEECHEDDNISSTLEDEEDPRLCSPLTDLEDKSSPSPKQTRTSATKVHIGGLASSTRRELIAKTMKNKSKEKSLDTPFEEATTQNKITNHEEKCTDGSSAKTKMPESVKEPPDRTFSKFRNNQMAMDSGRAKSLPPDASGIEGSIRKNSKKSYTKGRKRKSRPSSSSSLLEGNIERENTSTKDVNKKESVERLRFKKKRSCTPSPTQIKGPNKENIKQNPKTSEQTQSSTIEAIASLNKGGCNTKEIPSLQVDTIAAPDISSNMKNTSPSPDPRNVWWANAAAQAVAASGKDTIIGDPSSVGSGPIFNQDISISQWSSRGCPSPSQSGSNSNTKATALAAAGVASNSTITPPPPGPSTAMAELANLVNAHPRAGVGATGESVHDMRPFLRNLAAHQQRWTSVEDTHASGGNNVSCGLSEDNDSGPFQYIFLLFKLEG